MNENIKEILDYIKVELITNSDMPKESLITIRKIDTCKLLNYITNLQEELKSANESITWWQNRFNAVEKENNRLKEENKRIFSKVNDDELLISNAMNYTEAQEYKSRNKKAIEYIKENNCPDPYCLTGDLLNILNGDNK